MSIFEAIGGFVSGIFGPAANLIDNLNTSEEEKGKLRNELATIQAGVQTKLIELETKKLEATSAAMAAEAASSHWLAANWRPILALISGLVVLLDCFSLIKPPSPDFYEFARMYAGVYAGSRSVEKITDKVASVLKK